MHTIGSNSQYTTENTLISQEPVSKPSIKLVLKSQDSRSHAIIPTTSSGVNKDAKKHLKNKMNMASKSKFFFSKNSLFYILVEYQLRLVKMIFMSDSIDFVSILVSKIFVYGKFIYSSKCNGSEIIYVFSKDFLIKSIFKTSSTKSDNIAFCKPEKSSDKRNMFEHVKLIQFDMSKASNDANPNSSRSRQVRLVCLLNSIII